MKATRVSAVVLAAATVGAVVAISALTLVTRSIAKDADVATPDGSGAAVAPSAELHVRVVDEDTGELLLARLIVEGAGVAVVPALDGGLSGERAEGLVDLPDGRLDMHVPPGSYRISGFKGPEWSIDRETVEVGAPPASIELRLRRVVRAEGADRERRVACDLDVRSRPGPRPAVTEDAQLLALAAAGIGFAVATEHDGVGDYAAAASRTGLGRFVVLVRGADVETSEPAFGAFGVFPYSSTRPPPHRHTDAAALFRRARGGDPSRVIVARSPRAVGDAGDLDVAGFDALEVASGADVGDRARMDRALADWYALLNLGRHIVATGSSGPAGADWPGLARTYVDLGPWHQGFTGAPVDAELVVAMIKAGHSFVTNGPILDFAVADVAPGGELRLQGSVVSAHLRVRAAPWIDATGVTIVAGGKTIYEAAIPTRTTETAVRYDTRVELSVPRDARWVLAIVRGARAYDDVLPLAGVQPLAFTNPIWLSR